MPSALTDFAPPRTDADFEHAMLHWPDDVWRQYCSTAFRNWHDEVAPVVLAKDYDRCHAGQRLLPSKTKWGRDFQPNEPVLMRGARAALYYKNSLSKGHWKPAGYAREVVRRYMRMWKVTLHNKHYSFQFLEKLSDRLCHKHRGISHSSLCAWACREFGAFDAEITVNGERIFVEPAQQATLRKFRDLIDKTDALTVRVEGRL